MTLVEIREKFIPVWKQIEDFVPMSSKEEAKRFKMKRTKVRTGECKKDEDSRGLAKEMVEEIARDNQRMNEHIARDAEIARIYAKEELKMMIDGLDRNNEVIARHLQEYEEFKAELSIGEKIDLINELKKLKDLKGKGLRLEQGSAKRMKTAEDVSKEDIKEMM
uniref:Uncharacterized protein n=1 Tax=Tanacetum cinerariifolium TaxID=118510 RepID=A0A6L2MHI3_TANCI|nr:hypothetical protein [Tanacetum cinerariifolium]